MHQIVYHIRMIATRIDIIRIGEMIEVMIMITAKMSIDVMTITIQEGMKIAILIISVIVSIIMTVIIHLKEIIVTDNHTGEVVIKKTRSLIIFGDKMIIAKEIGASMISRSQNGLDNFNTNLEKGKIRILKMLIRNRVNLVVPRYQTAIFAGKMAIMQINVRQKKKERHQP